jgi:hypothetical protein
MPDQESSQMRSAQSARSYEGIEHPAKLSAAIRSWPRWSGTLRRYADDAGRVNVDDQRQSLDHRLRS